MLLFSHRSKLVSIWIAIARSWTALTEEKINDWENGKFIHWPLQEGTHAKHWCFWRMAAHKVSLPVKLGILTVCGIVTEVCQTILHVLMKDFVAYPSVAKWAEITREFGDCCNYLFCAGAVDWKHIRIWALANSSNEYYYYNDFSVWSWWQSTT